MQWAGVKNDWFDEECEEVTQKKNQVYLAMQQGRRTRAMAERLQGVEKERKANAQRKKKEHDNKKLKELESLQNQHEARKFYQSINNGRKDFKPRINTVKDYEGIIIRDKCNIIDRWREYFSEMLIIDQMCGSIHLEGYKVRKRMQKRTKIHHL